jgi:Family of unknown function (DUF5995)
MIEFSYNSYTSEFRSLVDVVAHMQAINQELEGTNLEKLRNFNTTYKIITEAVYSKMQENYFDDSARMEKFDIAFAKYYFKSLKGFTNKTTIPAAWQQCFEYCSRRNSAALFCMALGVNAHVNNDLPQTVFDVGYGSSYKSDFDKVNNVIQAQIPQIIDSLSNSHPYLVLYSHYPHLYRLVLNQIIAQWRSKAWSQYTSLMQGKVSRQKIEKSAGTIAKILQAAS